MEHDIQKQFAEDNGIGLESIGNERIVVMQFQIERRPGEYCICFVVK